MIACERASSEALFCCCPCGDVVEANHHPCPTPAPSSPLQGEVGERSLKDSMAETIHQRFFQVGVFPTEAGVFQKARRDPLGV